ncbi:hypothetical protein PG993_008991 [Apiospora rasikravindrae]|uniref:Citrate transporter-like domain-containing protein n=1 Tax=Apiospora rasikravindrae TaxID=990691 RepID=A0ABR1SJE6_9PEZI
MVLYIDNVDLDTRKIREWRSVVTLIVFVITNVVVLFPFHIPLYFPRKVVNGFLRTLAFLRVIAPRPKQTDGASTSTTWVRMEFPLNFITAPLVADLFLLAILAIGRSEVYGGTITSDNIEPIDIMVFFITLAYIAISIDASGLIRYLAFKVLQKGGEVGHKLFFYLYLFFFGLGSFVGNDPIILSGTAFLAYMTRVSSNIIHPRAWIHTQFAIANIASATLVSSNPTNLVLAGAFNIKFIIYTANMIVPVFVTALVLFPFLLYIIFADESLIPISIKMHELSEEAKAKKPVNPNIPHARGTAEEEENNLAGGDDTKLLSLEEIMNPFLDKRGATAGGVIMALTLACILVINAIKEVIGNQPVFYVTLPAAVLMLCWDLSQGWLHRHETREIAQRGRREVQYARAERAILERDSRRESATLGSDDASANPQDRPHSLSEKSSKSAQKDTPDVIVETRDGKHTEPTLHIGSHGNALSEEETETKRSPSEERRMRDLEGRISRELELQQQQGPATLVSVFIAARTWMQETFPTVTAVATHLPVALVPFALAMFVLVQALVTKGWVAVFAYGWDHWVIKTGTVGAIGGMAFLSVILCNFAGTNIGTTILLCRVIQSWMAIRDQDGADPISDRMFWATVYSMALGVNYGAFSIAFSGSLAGLLWRDILARKHIHVREVEFARVNLPIIAIAMVVGCLILVGEVYIMRRDDVRYHIDNVT